jgi:anaerobic selenocysteine-containing dehydrogenase
LLYDAGAMVSRTTHLRALARRPYIEMNDRDVKELALADGDDVVVEGNGATARLELVVADIAPGAVFVPFDQQGLRLNQFMSGVNPMVTVSGA